MKVNSGGAPAPQLPVQARSSRLFVSGTVGILLAALIYFVTIRLGVGFGVFVSPQPAEVVIFLILLAVSLLELPLMLFGLRRLRAGNANSMLVNAVNILFIAFAAVYAAVQVFLFGESNFSLLLAALSLARWGGSLAVV